MYGDFAMMVDAMIGEVLNALAENQMTQDTLVIFTSDNVLPHSSGVGQAAFSWHRSVFWSSQPLACM